MMTSAYPTNPSDGAWFKPLGASVWYVYHAEHQSGSGWISVDGRPGPGDVILNADGSRADNPLDSPLPEEGDNDA